MTMGSPRFVWINTNEIIFIMIFTRCGVCDPPLEAPGPADLGGALDLGHERAVCVQRGHRRAAIVQVHQHAVVGVGDAVAGERGVGLREGPVASVFQNQGTEYVRAPAKKWMHEVVVRSGSATDP